MQQLRTCIGCMILVLFAFYAQAQDKNIKVRVFDGSGQPMNEDKDEQKNQYDDKNYLYLNPYLLGRGVFLFGYERLLQEHHTVFIEAGLTYRDFVFETRGDDLDFTSDENVKVKPGKFLQIGYKLYPKGVDDFDDGFYLSPSFIYRDYNITKAYEFYDGNANVVMDINQNYKMNELALKFGYCRESWLSEDIISDVYFGVGYRNTSYNTYTDSGNGVITLETKKESKPAIYLGVKVGFLF